MNQEATWKRVDRLLSGPSKASWQNGKVLVIAGSSDALIIPGELKQDLSKLVAVDRYQWVEVDGAHEFPSTKSVETVEIIAEFWGL